MALNFGHGGNLFDLVVVAFVALYAGASGLYQANKVVAVVGETPVHYREIHAAPKDLDSKEGAKASDLLRLLREKERGNLKRRIRDLLERAHAAPQTADIRIMDKRFDGVVEEMKAEPVPKL